VHDARTARYRERPPGAAVGQRLRRHVLHQVLEVEGGLDERERLEPRGTDECVDLGLAGEVRDLELGAADGLDVGISATAL